MVGQTLDRYKIESKLGEGGMGVVYKARDTQLDRVVAIKVLPHDKVADPDRKQRFVQEAKAASALNHPGIVTVYDVGSDAGIDFIVMEYAGGRTLDRVISAKGLGITQALRYGVQIADALAKAHEAGIIHRDLKPSNVIVTDDDRVKVLDFGLAKLLDPIGGAAEAATRTVPLTEAGLVVGTTAYMSPEQAEGRKIDARSDIFSFGAVLYEMVTGRRPFVGETSLTVPAKIVNDDPTPPSQIAPSVLPDAERTVLRCLRKDPARRYQTMADLKVALEDLAADSASGRLAGRAVPRAAGYWRWGWAALIPILLAGTYLAWQASRTPRSAAALRAVPLTALPGVVRYPSFSPDGNHVAFTWSGPNQDNPDLYVQQIGAGAPLRLTTDPANDYSPVWSPDGRAIAFLRQQSDPRRHELRLIPPLGGSERKLAEIQPRGFLRSVTLAWCPDSKCVLVTDSATPDGKGPDVLFIVSVESGERRQLTTTTPFADTDPALSPDGRWLVFRRDVSPFSGQLQLLQLGAGFMAKGEPRSLTPVLLSAYTPEWISNHEIVFSAKGALWRMTTSEGSTPERLPFGEDGLMPTVSQPQSSQPARLAYVRNYTDTNIWRVETSAPGVPASSLPAVAISSTRRDEVAQFSPDGRRVAFMSGRSGEWEVWVADASGGNAVQLTFLAAVPGWPRWSPDGRTIAFHSNSEGQSTGDVFVVPADGGALRNVTSHPATDTFPSFSHDGQWIYFCSSRSGTPSIWKIPVSGGSAVQISPRPGLLAIESSDGAYLYSVESAATDGSGPLWRLPLKGGEPVKLVEDVAAMDFDVIDGGVYYLARGAGEKRLQYFDFATRRSTTVADKLGIANAGLTASRDGRTILFSRLDSSVNDVMLVENFR